MSLPPDKRNQTKERIYMKILVCEPGKHPYVKDIEHTLENLQAEVDGYIQAIYPFEE